MKKQSKLKRKTIEILKKKLLRDLEEGGISQLTVGPPGEGKTCQLVHDAKAIFQYHPKEMVFWRDNPKSTVQYNKKGVQYKILVEQGVNIRFRNKSSGGPLKIKYDTFNNFNDIIDMDTGNGLAELGKLNVIYFKNEYSWIDFLEHLRHCIGWQCVLIDEIEDLIPLNPPKKVGENRNIRYEKNLEFAANFKELRKDWVNFFANTQDLADVDHRVRRKTNIIVYLGGSRVERKSKVKQGAINKLKKGSAFIEWEHSKFGKISFGYYPNRNPYFEVILE